MAGGIGSTGSSMLGILQSANQTDEKYALATQLESKRHELAMMIIQAIGK